MLKLILFLLIWFASPFLLAQSYQWSTTSCPPAQSRFDDMSFIDTQRGWVIDFMGNMYNTTDGGITWNSMTGPPSNVYRSVLFLDSLNGFVGLLGCSYNPDSSILYSTINGGITWSPVNNFPFPPGYRIDAGGICGMCKVEDSVIYACGRFWGPTFIYRSGDYGQTWQRFDMGSQAFGLVDIYFWSKDSGIVVGAVDTTLNAIYANSAIFRTVNGGNSWQLVYQSQMQEEWCWKISAPEPGMFYVSVEQFGFGSRYILKSTDYGSTWTEMNYSFQPGPPPSHNNISNQGIGFRTANEGWVAINNSSAVTNSFFHTLDGGLTWLPENVEYGINRFRFLNDSIGFASGFHVLKMQSGILAIQEYQRSDMILSPTVTTGNVKIIFPDPSEKEIKIINIDGALLNKLIVAGDEYELDLSGFGPGIYFILAKSSRAYASEKVMLIK